MNGIGFYKMNGAGNEIVVLDLRADDRAVTPDAARAIARLEGAFFDQLMVLLPPQSEDTAAFVEIWNNDGSRSGACGNGTRCIAALEMERTGLEEIGFETEAGLLQTSRSGSQITVDMGIPKFGWADIPLAEFAEDTTAIDLTYANHGVHLANPAVANMGNPHAIFWVEDVNAFDLSQIGPELEHHVQFPEKANISLAQVISSDRILLKVWERGAGETRACGSAACATAASAARMGKTERNVTICLPGGELEMAWRPDDHMLMTGPWELEHRGMLPDHVLTRFNPAQNVA